MNKVWSACPFSFQVADRQGLVDAFNQNEDITVFLLSTCAGGLGLNLTAANTVVSYDCDYKSVVPSPSALSFD
ncbi:hypothetical protein JCM8547_004352 [Rhodosporidiobolus lusitaniae]